MAVKLDFVKRNAMFASCQDYYIKHLEDCNWNPTIGAIARQQFSVPKRNNLIKTPTEKYLEKTLKDYINSLYPKTKKIRNYIVKSNRLNLDFVTKSTGYSFMDRLKIFMMIK